MSITPFPMPNDLRQMELQVLNGADPDSIHGIERLWLWRIKTTQPQWSEHQRKFFEWLRASAHGQAEAKDGT